MKILSTEMDGFVRKTHKFMLENLKKGIESPTVIFTELSPTNFYKITMKRMRDKPDFIKNPLEVHRIEMKQSAELEYCYCPRFTFDESWMIADESVRRPLSQKNYSKILTTGKHSLKTTSDRYILVVEYESDLSGVCQRGGGGYFF